MIELVLLFAIAAGFALLFWSTLNSGMLAHVPMRERAMRQFRSTVLDVPSVGARFDGSEAEILESHESHYLAGLLPSNYVLTVKARMPDGVEFEFKSDPTGKPWVMCRSRGDGHGVRAHAAY